MKRYGLAAILLFLSGCASITPHPASKGGAMLDEGIKRYEDGNYGDAVAEIQKALHAGLSDQEKVKAHKFLAFIYCVSDKQTLCKTEFTKALAIDPKFNLAPDEAGHPIWGPVFRSVKPTKK